MKKFKRQRHWAQKGPFAELKSKLFYGLTREHASETASTNRGRYGTLPGVFTRRRYANYRSCIIENGGRLSAVFLYNNRGVVAAKPKGIAKGSFNGTMLGFVKCKVQLGIQFRIIGEVIDGRRNDITGYG
jgi:hypothetical protein